MMPNPFVHAETPTPVDGKESPSNMIGLTCRTPKKRPLEEPEESLTAIHFVEHLKQYSAKLKILMRF